jgi:hypothetical protein
MDENRVRAIFCPVQVGRIAETLIFGSLEGHLFTKGFQANYIIGHMKSSQEWSKQHSQSKRNYFKNEGGTIGLAQIRGACSKIRISKVVRHHFLYCKLSNINYSVLL